MADIQYEAPQDIAKALQLLAEAGTESRVIAGGTNLLPALRDRAMQPKLLVDVGRLPNWREIRLTENSVQLAPGCTVTNLLEHPQLRESASLLHETARWFAGPSIRNRATVAGNIADASPAADMAIPLLAMDGEVEISRFGHPSRKLSLTRFFKGPGISCLDSSELITGFSLSRLDGWKTGYFKLGKRDSMAISIVSCALALRLEGRTCVEARIALGAVAPIPFRAQRAEEALIGRELHPTVVHEAGRLARDEARPIGDSRASARYRSEMIEVLVARLLSSVAA